MWIYNTLTYASLLVYLEQFIDKIYSIVDLYLEQRVGCVMLWFPLYKLIVRPITAPSICSDQNISPRFLIAFQTNFTANLYTNFPLSRFFFVLGMPTFLHSVFLSILFCSSSTCWFAFAHSTPRMTSVTKPKKKSQNLRNIQSSWIIWRNITCQDF